MQGEARSGDGVVPGFGARVAFEGYEEGVYCVEDDIGPEHDVNENVESVAAVDDEDGDVLQ